MLFLMSFLLSMKTRYIIHVPFECVSRHWSIDNLSGDPKPLVTLQSPQKVRIQIALHRRLQKGK